MNSYMDYIWVLLGVIVFIVVAGAIFNAHFIFAERRAKEHMRRLEKELTYKSDNFEKYMNKPKSDYSEDICDKNCKVCIVETCPIDEKLNQIVRNNYDTAEKLKNESRED